MQKRTSERAAARRELHFLMRLLRLRLPLSVGVRRVCSTSIACYIRIAFRTDDRIWAAGIVCGLDWQGRNTVPENEAKHIYGLGQRSALFISKFAPVKRLSGAPAAACGGSIR